MYKLTTALLLFLKNIIVMNNKINILYNFVFLIPIRTTSCNNNVICNTGMNLASLAECKYLYKATTIW